ncbi:hypothetical protein F2P81_004759 [Scophthalmus maximus]|uniref:Uncharacterized protein n=1 Tax=Scophthalmus maximus TaxID=52904 RepID=A0A6A4TN57_SCOMX|nr:hypothetical protein F2P81_004759 [Scophthalmus maximus]
MVFYCTAIVYRGTCQQLKASQVCSAGRDYTVQNLSSCCSAHSPDGPKLTSRVTSEHQTLLQWSLDPLPVMFLIMSNLIPLKPPVDTLQQQLKARLQTATPSSRGWPRALVNVRILD